MIVKVKDIVVNSIASVYSAPVTFSVPSQMERLDIENMGSEFSIFAVSHGNVEYKNYFFIDKKITIKIKFTPTPSSVSGNYSINLVNDKFSETVILTGRVIINSLVNISEIAVTGANCNPILREGKLKLLLDQTKYGSCSFTLIGTGIATSDGAVTDYSIKSKNNIIVTGDNYLVKNSISSISFSSNICTIQLANPNAIGHVLDTYGFTQETEYILTFTKDVSIFGNTFKLNVIINLNYKSIVVNTQTIRTQEAVFDIYHKATLINHDFALNINANGKQFSFGLNTTKQYSVPVKLNTIIPKALTFPFSDGLKPLEIIIYAQSVTKIKNYYSAKLILQIKPFSNRELIAGNYTIPAYFKIRNFKHKFDIPVKLNA
jgi:hypothetical protein